MVKRKILIDCDPGIDDAVMLMLAFSARSELDILGVTTVAGNLPLSLTTTNACIIRALSKREDTPIYAGCPRPMVRDVIEASEFHGKNGLADLVFPTPKQLAESGHGVDFLEKSLLEATEPVTLVVTGPFTNVALAIIKNPAILDSVDQIVIMGGARTEAGNYTASAEFNVAADPHAAHVLFTCGKPIVAFGLDVTHRALATPERIAAIEAIGQPHASAVAAMLKWVAKVEKDLKGYAGAPLHDPCTIAFLLAPELFSFKPCHVAVEINSPLTAGHTAVDYWNTTSKKPNTQWADHVDDDRLFVLITERLKTL